MTQYQIKDLIVVCPPLRVGIRNRNYDNKLVSFSSQDQNLRLEMLAKVTHLPPISPRMRIFKGKQKAYRYLLRAQ